MGAAYYWVDDAFSFSLKSGLYAALFGVTWGVATGLVAYGLLNFEISISQLAPLYNMNTLVAVLLALIIFSEWKDVNAIKLLCGSALIVGGAVLVANA